MVEIKNKGFGERVTEAMQKQGLGPSRLARMMGFDRPEMIRRYRMGTAIPQGENMKRLAEILGVSVDYLLYGRQPISDAIAFELFGQGLAAVEEYMARHGVDLPARVQGKAAWEIAQDLHEGKTIDDHRIAVIFLKMIA